MRPERFDLLAVCRGVWYGGRLFVANRIVAWIPSHELRLLFYRTVMKAKIGKHTSIHMGAYFTTVGHLTIGDNSVINPSCTLDARGGLTIGSNVSISAQVCILTADHDVQSRNFAGRKAPVIIDDYVFAGTRAMILPGVSLKKGAVVAAGAVATKDVDEYTVVGGVPARAIGKRNSDLDYDCFFRPFFS